MFEIVALLKRDKHFHHARKKVIFTYQTASPEEFTKKIFSVYLICFLCCYSMGRLCKCLFSGIDRSVGLLPVSLLFNFGFPLLVQSYELTLMHHYKVFFYMKDGYSVSRCIAALLFLGFPKSFYLTILKCLINMGFKGQVLIKKIPLFFFYFSI